LNPQFSEWMMNQQFEGPMPLDNLTSYIYIVDMAELLGTFEQIVLLAVLGLGEEAYGRAVLRAVQVASQDVRSISAGAVYATLDRVETKGLLSSRVEKGTPARGGRARRFYRLTSTGASALTDARRTLEKMWQGKSWPLEVFK
jgi:DNA-binding PadR family transcriptional regulator